MMASDKAILTKSFEHEIEKEWIYKFGERLNLSKTDIDKMEKGFKPKKELLKKLVPNMNEQELEKKDIDLLFPFSVKPKSYDVFDNYAETDHALLLLIYIKGLDRLALILPNESKLMLEKHLIYKRKESEQRAAILD